VLRVCLRDGRSGADAYARLNREILELGPRHRFCTSALAILRPGPVHTTVSITVAGHPLPVLARADKRVETVGVPGMLIGVEPALSVHESEVLLSPGDALVLYTDGVTERRRGSVMLDEDGLLAAVTEAIGASADNLAAAVERTVKDFSPETSRDDLAILVVRRPMSPAPTKASDLSAAHAP
jgi:serine phosphatase RsbU (regulator of sigma subunit)